MGLKPGGGKVITRVFGVSNSVLDAAALQLDGAERVYLFDLGRAVNAAGRPTQAVRRAVSAAQDRRGADSPLTRGQSGAADPQIAQTGDRRQQCVQPLVGNRDAVSDQLVQWPHGAVEPTVRRHGVALDTTM